MQKKAPKPVGGFYENHVAYFPRRVLRRPRKRVEVITKKTKPSSQNPGVMVFSIRGKGKPLI